MGAVALLSRNAKSLLKKSLASLNDPLAARPSGVFMRDEFKRFVDRYESAGAADRKRLSLQLINKLSVDAGAGAFLEHPAYLRIFDGSDYFHHGRIAYAYASGSLVRAELVARTLYAKSEKPFNAWLFARCLRAAGKKEEAIELLRRSSERFKTDGDLALELASQLYWTGHRTEANALLAAAPAGAVPVGGIDQLKKELADAQSGNAHLRKGGGDIYDEQYVIDTWWRYWRYFNQLTELQHNEPFVMEAILRRLSSAIEQTSPKTVIDFGALCGEINYRLAKKFPAIDVHGVDRQEIIKRLNDDAYSLPNLHFREGDIFESLKVINDAPVLFTHTRTTVLCYPDFVQKLYNECHAKGVETIVGFEPSGISRDTGRFPEYADADNSVAFRTVMMLHNYPAMLEQAGYRITKSEMVPVSFLYFDDPGYHLFYFEATRV
ncbi:hypothetical protein HF272_13810 [Rhizobium leguminosarum]|uniref:class I SAM-dependent methyltransferase n=1 Tax=Rhizobium leguminosarum TaxID=384 RepID=UPI001C9178B1|nr:class I SAM-dependent methyltransferase [Rhizobium leguminosarum]MBY2992506.1 hypothetical protein [Rhizobium leguminosarum]